MGFRVFYVISFLVITGLSRIILIFLKTTHFMNFSGHNYIGSEHLLLGLLREGEGVAARVLENLGADPSNIRTQASIICSFTSNTFLFVLWEFLDCYFKKKN
jgi:hypothetical protein